jgi:hypothetical protein
MAAVLGSRRVCAMENERWEEGQRGPGTRPGRRGGQAQGPADAVTQARTGPSPSLGGVRTEACTGGGGTQDSGSCA